MPAINPAASEDVGSARTLYNDAVAGAVVAVKASAGQLYALKVINTTAAAAYLQVFFRPAAGVTLGTTVPDLVVPLAANEALTWMLPVPVGALTSAGAGGTGLSVAGTTTPGGAVGAALKVAAVFA